MASQVSLNGGVYPNEDGTWRMAVWFSGMKTEAEAKEFSNWMGALISKNMTPATQPPQADQSQQPPPAAPVGNGAAQQEVK